jgi:hypothetical protein
MKNVIVSLLVRAARWLDPGNLAPVWRPTER